MIGLFISFLLLIGTIENVKGQVQAHAGNDTTICLGDSVRLGASSGTASGGTGYYSYLWSPPNWLSGTTIQHPYAKPLNDIGYSLTVSDDTAHTQALDVVYVYVVMKPNAQITQYPDPQLHCPDDSVTLTAVPTQPGYYDYLWQRNGVNFGGNIPQIKVNKSGIYRCIIQVKNCGCRDTSNLITLAFVAMPWPKCSIDPNPPRKCTPSANVSFWVTLTNSQQSPPTPITQNLIEWEEGSGFQNVTPFTIPQAHEYTAMGYFKITYRVIGAGPEFCHHDTTFMVYIGNTPHGSVLNAGNALQCKPYNDTLEWSNDIIQSIGTAVTTNTPGTKYYVFFSDTHTQLYFDQMNIANNIKFPYIFNKTSCGQEAPGSWHAPIPVNSPMVDPNQIYVYYLIYNGCNPPSQGYLPFILQANPSVNMLPVTDKCAGDAVSLTAVIDPPGSFTTGASCDSTFKTAWKIKPSTGWTLSSGSLGTTSTSNIFSIGTSGTQQVVLNFQNSGCYWITIITSNNADCPHGVDSIGQKICIFPKPVVNPTPNDTVCSGAIAGPIAFSGTAGATFSWTSTINIGQPSSGTDTIHAFTAVNTGTSPIVATFIVTPIENCTGDPKFFNIVVNPIPNVTVSNNTVCNGKPVSVNFSGTVNGTIYKWTNDNTSIGLAQQGTGSIPVFNAINTGTTAVIATITVTPYYYKGDTCEGIPKTFTITVYPTPTVNPVSNLVLCNGQPTTDFLFAGAISGTTYTWSNTKTSIGLAASGTGYILSFNAVNTGTSPVIATVTVTPSSNGCSGTPTVFTITVNPTPTMNTLTNQTLCNGSLTTAINFTGTVSGTTFTWVNSNTAIGLGPSGSVNIPSFNATNTTTSSISGTVTVIPAANGCTGTAKNCIITVNPMPDVVVPANQTVCNGVNSTQVNLSGSVPGTTFAWTNSNPSIGLGASGTGTINAFAATNSGTSPVTATITVTPKTLSTTPVCQGTQVSFTITVNPTPQVNSASIPNQTLCNNAMSTQVIFTGTVSGTSYAWTNTSTSIGLGSSGSGDILPFQVLNTGNTPITATISVTPTANGCNGPVKTFTIKVNPTPTVNPVSGQEVCNSNTVSAISFNGSVTGTAYSWSNSNTTIGLGSSGTGTIASFTGHNNGTSPVVSTVTVTPTANTCPGSPVSFTITVNPTPSVDPISSISYCNGATAAAVTFTGPVSGTAFSWVNSIPAIGLGASGNNSLPLFTATNGTNAPLLATISITPVAASCPGSVSTYTITVQPVPNVNTIPDQGFCSGASVTLPGFSSAVTATTYVWANSNSSIGLGSGGSGNIPPFVTQNSSGGTLTSLVTVTPSANSCEGPAFSFQVSVSENQSPSVFPLPINQTVCHNQSTTAINFSGPVSGTTYSWTNSNAAIGIGSSGLGDFPAFTAVNTTTNPVVANITVIPTSTGCDGSMASFTITANPIPVVNDIANQTRCNGQMTQTITFTGTVAGTSYSWLNDNTTIGLASAGTGNIPAFSPVNTGTVPVTATVTVTPTANGCTGASKTFTFTINPTPTVAAVSNQAVCNNQSTGIIVFTGGVSGTTYSWSNNKTSIGLPATGTGNINAFTAHNTGSSSTVATISVTPTANGCAGQAVSFTISVYPTPVANAGSNASVWYNNTITLNGSASNGSGSYNFLWSPQSALSTSNAIANPVSIPMTVQTIYTLTVTDNTTGCVSQPAQVTISILGSPITVTAGASPSTVCKGNQVLLSATPSGGNPTAYSYSWSSNPPGFTSNQQNPAVTPTVTTTYTVTLSDGPNSATSSVTVTVNPIPTVNTISNQVLCSGDFTTSVSFSGTVPGTVYNWTNNKISIGLQGSGTVDIGSFQAMNTGVTPVIATITITPTASNCAGTSISFTITVNPMPQLTAISSQVRCNNTSTAAINFSSSVSGSNYTWTNSQTSIGLAGLGTGNIGSFTATNAGNTTVVANLSAIPHANGCNGSQQNFTITVNPTPNAAPIANIINCAGTQVSAINFTGNVSGTVYNWTNTNTLIGLGGSGSGSIPSFSALNALTTPLTANVSVNPTANSCAGPQMSFSIKINPIPSVNPVGSQVVCNGAYTTAILFSGNAATSSFNWSYTGPGIGLVTPGSGNIVGFSATTGATLTAAPFTVVPQYYDPQLSCNGNPATFQITVLPLPSVNPVANLVLCDGSSSGMITFTSPDAGTSFTWTNSNTSIGLATGGSGSISSFTVVNTGFVPLTATINVKPAYSLLGVDCNGSSQQFTITVNPTPQVNALSSVSICNNTSFQSVFTGPVSGTLFTWSYSDPDIGIGTGGLNQIGPVTVINNGTAALTGTVTVTPSYSNNGVTCTGPSKTMSITVNPTPTISLASIPSQLVVSGQATNAVMFSGSVAGTAYTWTNSLTNIGLTGSGSGNIASFTAINPGPPPLTATIYVTPTANQCSGPVQNFTITVNPLPFVNPVVNQVVCNGQPITPVLFTSLPSGTVCYWNNNLTSIGLQTNGTGDILAFTAINTGTSPVTSTITVTPKLTINGTTYTGAPKTFTITVNPTPTVNSLTGQTVCNNAQTAVINFTGPVAGTSFLWTNSNSIIGLAGSGTGNIPSFMATNTATTPSSGLISITPYANNCQGTVSTVQITVNPVPIVTAVPNQSVCNGLPTAAINFSASVAGTTFTWTNSDPQIGLGASGSGNIASFQALNGSTAAVTATISVTPIASTCPGPVFPFTILVNPTPTVNSLSGQVKCNGSGTSPVSFGSTVAGTVFAWSNSNSTVGLPSSGNGNIPAFTATNTGSSPIQAIVTVVPTANTCIGPSSSFSFTVNPTPLLSPVSNQSICAGTTVYIPAFSGPVTASSFSWTNNLPSIGLSLSGSGNIQPFTAILNSVLPATASISVTPSANGCTGTTGYFSITVNPVPSVNTIGDGAYCTGSTLAPVNLTGPVSGTTYSWTCSSTTIGLTPLSGSNLIPSFTATTGNNPSSALLSITPFTSNCTGTVYSFNITVNPLPFAYAGPDQTINYGTSAMLNGSSIPAACAFVWSPANTLNPPASASIPTPNTVNLSATQAFHLMVTNPLTSCSSPVDEVMVFVSGNPLATTIETIPDSICRGDSTQILLTPTGGSLVYSYLWSPSLSLSSATIANPLAKPNVTTMYHVTVSDGYSTVKDSVKVTVIQPPAVFAGLDTSICSDQALFITNWATASNFSSLQWTSSGTGTFSNPSALNTLYTPSASDIGLGLAELSLQAIGITPCYDSIHSFLLTIFPKTLAETGPDTSICAGQNYFLSAASAQFANTYFWTTSGSGTFNNNTILNPVYYPGSSDTSNGMVTLSLHAEVSGLECGKDSATMTLIIWPKPNVNAGNDAGMCAGDSVQLHGSGGISYQWNNIFTLNSYIIPDPLAMPSSTTTYSLTVSDEHSCSGIDSITVTVHPLPLVNAGANTGICLGDSIQLNASGGVTFLWSPGTGLSSVITANPWAHPATSCNYYVTVSDSFDCKDIDSIGITVRPLPFVSVSAPVSDICKGTSVTFTAQGASTYSWTPSNSLSSGTGQSVVAIPYMSTVYQVTGSDVFGCRASDSLFIRVYSWPELNLITVGNSCIGDPVRLMAGYNDSLEYTWQDGSHGRYYLVTDTGLYWVTASNQICAVSDSLRIAMCTYVWVPNAFTPGKDDLNSWFVAKASTALKNFHMVILNRWGGVVFESNDIMNGWDGRYKGVMCPVDVYVYRISYLGLSDDKDYQRHGTVTLLR